MLQGLRELRRRHRRRMRQGERGSVLIIAIVMVFVVALIVAGVLAYSGTGLNANRAVSTDSHSQYGADGATETAIQNLAKNAGTCATPVSVSATTTNGSTAMTSSGAFTSAMVGGAVTGPGISTDPNVHTVVKTFTDPSHIVLSTPAGTGAGAGTFTIATTQTALDVPPTAGQPAVHVDCIRTNPPSTPGNGGTNSDQPKYAIQTQGERANEPSNEGSYNWNFSSWPPPWGQIAESGLFFQPAVTGLNCGFFLGFCYKQTGDVLIAGGVFSNSTVSVNNPTNSGTQAIKTTDPSSFGFTVRQPCGVSGHAVITPNCASIGYGKDGQGLDPGYPSRGDWQVANGGGFPQPQAVPACGSSSLVVFQPGWYNDANALNNLFATCANGDGTGKDYWFRPGVYYFDFRNTTGQPKSIGGDVDNNQYCGVGVDNSPVDPVSNSTMQNDPAYAHEWCIRGKFASDGHPNSSADAYRPHIIGGAPLAWSPDPITLLMQAATASSTTFSTPSNGAAIDTNTANVSWSSSSSTMTPNTATSTDIAPANNAKLIDSLLASLTLASQVTTQTPNSAASSDIVPANNAKLIDSLTAALTLASNSVTQTPGNAASADFSTPTNAKLIDALLSSLTLATSSTVQTPGAAASADFVIPDNGRVIDGVLTSLALASSTTVQTPGSASSADFTNPNLGRVMDDALATLALSASTTTQTPGTATSADFANPNGGRTIGDASTASLSLSSSTATQTPGTATSADFANPNGGRTIGDASTASLTIGSASQSLNANSASASNTTGAADFTNTSNALGAPNGTLSTSTFSNSATAGPTAAASSQAVAGTDDFTNKNNALTYNDGTLATANWSGSTTVTLAPATTVENSPSSGFDDFNGPNNALSINGGNMTTGNVSASYGSSCFFGSCGSAELRLSGYPDIPATATPSAVTLSIRHYESNSSIDSINVLVQNSSNQTLCTLPLSRQSNNNQASPYTQVNIGPSASGGNNCVTTAAQVNGLKLDYQVEGSGFIGSAATFYLDGMQLSVTYNDTANRTLALSSIAPQFPNPAATTIDAATLNVRHQETGTAANQRLVLSGPNISGSAACNTIPLPTRASLTIDSIDLRDQLANAAKCNIAANQLAATINGLTITYTANLSAGGVTTVSVDGMNLVMTATDATVRSLILTTPNIPAPNTLDTVSLSITHQETGSSTSPQLVITPNGAGACTPIALTPRAALTTDTVTIPAGCLNTTAKFNGATYAYQVHLTDAGNVAQAATANVDAISATVLSTDTSTHSLTLSGLTPTVNISASGTIDSVTLSFAHQETGSAASPQLAITPGGASACAPINLTPRAAMTTDVVTVPAGCLNTATKINGATFAYQVHLTDNGASQSATIAVDGLSVATLWTDGGLHTITLSAMSPAVPAGFTIDNVKVSIAHQEAGNGLSPTLVITPGGASACAPIALTPRAAMTTDVVDVSSCLNTATKINGAAYAYQVNLTDNGAAQSATATLDGVSIATIATDTAIHSLTLSSPAPVVPAADTIDSVTLQIRHQESGSSASPQLVITPGGAGACAAINLTPRSTLTTDTVTVPAGCLTTAARINGATYAYQVHLTDTGSAQNANVGVDGLTLTVVSTNGANHTLTLSAPSPNVPATDTIDSVSLQFAHQETGNGVSPQLIITPGGSGPCSAINLTPRATLTTDTVTVPAGCLNTPAKINGASYQYVVHLTDNGTAQSSNVNVDGLKLSVGSTDATTHSLTLSAPAPSATISGTLESVKLSFAHQETGSNANPQLIITPGGAGACAPINLTPRSTLTTDVIDVTSCLNTATKINGASYQYVVHLVDNGSIQSSTVSVDGLSIAVLSNDSTTHTLTLSSMTPAVSGSGTPENVKVSFAHQEAGSNVSPQLVITPGGGGTCTFNLTQRQALTTDVIDVTSCLNTLTKINGASYQYRVHLTPNGTAQSTSVNVDGLSTATQFTNGSTHSITLSNLSNPLPATPGYVVDSASLSFAHQETGSNTSPQLVVTRGGGGTCTFNLTPRASLTTDTIDVTACLDTPARLNGASVQYQVHLTPDGSTQNATVNVDGMSIAASATDTSAKSITVSGFAPSLPASVTGATVTVDVAHAETGASVSPQLVVTPASGTGCTVSLPVHATLATDSGVAIPCLTTTAQINGATVAYQVSVPGGPVSATGSLDGMNMHVAYTQRPTAFPGSCDSSKPGVQWIFGGDSHVYIPDAQVELCAGTPPGNPGQTGYTAQQIAVYGVPPTPAMVPSTIVSNPGGYPNTNNIICNPATTQAGCSPIGDYDSGGGIATSDVSMPLFGSGKAVTVGGFNATTVPAGLVVQNVTARVSHLENGLAFGSPSISFKNALNQNCGTIGLTSNLLGFAFGPQYETKDVTSCFSAGGALGAGITATFTSATGLGTEQLDGIELDVTLAPASPSSQVFVPESGCITALPNFWDGMNNPDCAVWKWDSAENAQLFGFNFLPSLCVTNQPAGKACLPNAQVSVQGTFYAPGAPISVDDQGPRDVSLSGCNQGNGVACYSGVNYPIFNRGVIARTLRFNSYKGATGFSGAVVGCAGGNCNGGNIPNPRDVTLHAYVCADGQSSCTSATGTLRVSADVTIPLDPSSAKATISAWNAT